VQGEVCGFGIVVLPPRGLGQRVARFGLAGLGFLHADQGGLAVVAGGLVLAEVAEQDAGVGQQVAVDPD
jgi:hypothetical protein